MQVVLLDVDYFYNLCAALLQYITFTIHYKKSIYLLLNFTLLWNRFLLSFTEGEAEDSET